MPIGMAEERRLHWHPETQSEMLWEIRCSELRGRSPDFDVTSASLGSLAGRGHEVMQITRWM